MGRVCDVCTLGGRQRVWVCVCVCDVRACTCVCVGACGSDHLGCLREVGRHGGLGEQQQGTESLPVRKSESGWLGPLSV